MNNSHSSKKNAFRILTHDFSDVEDSDEAFEIIRELAGKAGRNAASEAKVAGLTRVYIRNHETLVKILPDGNEKILSPRLKKKEFYINYKPSTVFYAVNK